jgi:hypothetical protein
MEGVAIVGKQESSGRSLSEERILTEEKLEASLPGNLQARQGVLDKLVLQKLSDFLTTHSLQVEVHVGRKLKGKHEALLDSGELPIVRYSVSRWFLNVYAFA